MANEGQPVKPAAFVLMPFDPDFREIYDLFIKDALESAGYVVGRADDLLAQRSILQDILDSIRAAELVVADLTTSNPNVFYELGLAHAMRRPVIMITQTLDDVPFDLRGYRVVIYDTHFARLPKARQELVALATASREGRLPLGTPVSDYSPSGHDDGKSPPTLLTDSPTGLVSSSAEEGGFLDYIVEVEESFGKLTEVVDSVGGATIDIGDVTREFTARLTNLASSPGPGTASVLRHLTREFAGKVRSYALTISAANERYRELWRRLGPSLELLIASYSPNEASQRDSFEKFLHVISDVAGHAREARTSYASLADSMAAVPHMERQLNQAMNSAAAQARAFVDNIDQTIASFERAHGVGKAGLEKSSVS